MNKKGEMGIGSIVMVFVAIVVIVGAFIPSIFNTQSTMTDLQPIADESFNIQSLGCLLPNGEVNESSSNCNLTLAQWTAYNSDWRTSESQCYPSSIVVTNASGTALTLDTDYTVVASSGLVNMLNTTDTANTTNGNSLLIDYNYCDSGYNKDSSSRSSAGLIGLLSALAFVLFVFGVAKKTGVF